MEKNILLEINRNLELMKVKPLVIENTIDPINDILQNLYTKIKTSLEGYKTLKIPNFQNLQTIKNIFTDFSIPYSAKLEAVVEILSKYDNSLNDSRIVTIIFNDIVDKIKKNYPNNFMSIIENSIKTYPQNYSQINDIIKVEFNKEGIDLTNISTAELEILRCYIYVLLKNSYQNIEIHKPTKDFFEWFVKTASEKTKKNLRVEGMNADDLFDKNPNLIYNIVGEKTVLDSFKYLSLKTYLGLDNNQISTFTDLIIDLAKDKNFIENLKKYYSNYSDPKNFDEFLDKIWEMSNQQGINNIKELYKKLRTFILILDDLEKTKVLFLNLKFFIDTGYAGDIVEKIKPSNFSKFFLKNMPLYSKFNLAKRLIYNNLVKRRELVNTQMASILIQASNDLMANPDSKEQVIKQYRAAAQKFFVGYYVQTGQDIGANMVEPLIELQKAIDKDGNPNLINQVTELITTFEKIPKDVNGAFKNINIYLKFYEELTAKSGEKISNSKNITKLLYTAFNPFGEKWNTHITKKTTKYFSDENIWKRSLNSIITISRHPLAQAWFFGAPINLKLIVTCIKIYSKRLKASQTLTQKATVILVLYITYTIANIFYRISLLIFLPFIQTWITFIGIGIDKIIDPALDRLNIGWEGFVSRANEQKYGTNSSATGLGAASKIFLNIFMYKFRKYFIQMISMSLENQTNKSFSKLLGENWVQILVDPAFTNFENGQFFKSIVDVYNVSNNKQLQTFKQTLWDALWGTGQELIKHIKNTPELNEIDTTSTTNQINYKSYKYDPMYKEIYVPNFSFERIKSIKLNNRDITSQARINSSGGIVIENVSENDVKDIRITSKYNNIIYQLKNQ